jgi:hypothetical protein
MIENSHCNHARKTIYMAPHEAQQICASDLSYGAKGMQGHSNVKLRMKASDKDMTPYA